MPITLLDFIRSGGDFALMGANDIEMANGTRLDAFLTEQIAALGATDEATAKQIAVLLTQIQLLSGADTAIGEQIAALITQDTAFAAQLQNQTEAMQALETRLTAADAAFEAADKAFEAADKALQAADAAFAATDTELANRTTALENRFKAMDYGEGITLSFGHNVAAKEKGSVITSVPLSWSYGKAEYLVSQELNGVALPLEQRSMTATTWPNEPDRPLAITMDSGTWPTWTIKATDSESKVVTKSVHNFTFLNAVYYGSAPANDNIDSAFIMGLAQTPGGKKELNSSKNLTVKFTTGDGLYAWYAYPKRLGTSLFNYGGFDYRYLEQVYLFENQHGVKEEYYVYRSEALAPPITVTVKNGG